VRQDDPSLVEDSSFDCAVAAWMLYHVHDVDRCWLVFPDRRAVQAFVDSLIRLSGCTVPAFDGPIRVRRTPVVFVAERE
jgi:hypothetical protein